jgi:hypothetical protein
MSSTAYMVMVKCNDDVTTDRRPTPGWNYNESRANLLDVYPTFIEHYRTLIYNGDFDACVPYLHNSEWVKDLSAKKGWSTAREWEPWLVDGMTGGCVTCCWTDYSFVRGMLLGFTMLCDIIGAMTEFMVRVLHSRSAIWIHDGYGDEA